MADKLTIGKKMSGKASYQVASTMFEGYTKRFVEVAVEKERSKFRKFVTKEGNHIYGSGTLNYYDPVYDKETGNITSVREMEIMLPDYLKSYISKGDVLDERLLQLIGFRIPTQGLNSVEVMKVAGFLSPSLGDIVVVPSEIVIKAGSDFDIDKLNMYIPHFYKDSNGKAVYIENTPEAFYNYVDDTQKAFLNKVLEEVYEQSTFGRSEYLGNLLNKVIKKIKSNDGLFEVSDLLEELKAEASLRATPSEDLIVAISYLQEMVDSNGDTAITMTESEYMNAAIENELISVYRDIALHPDNIRQLLNPIDSDDFKDLGKDIESKLNENPLVDTLKTDNKSYASYGSVRHHLQLSKQNMEGAGGVGIAANAGVFQVYGAKHGFRINHQITTYNAKGEATTITTEINLPHNVIDGFVSIGGMQDSEGNKFIYEILNAYISLTVDNAKDPILDKLNAGLKTLNTVLYMAMAGVPYDTLHYFMSQPIIMNYVQNLAIYESQVYQATEDKRKYSDEIAKETIIEFTRKFFTLTKLNPKGFSRSKTTKTFTKEDLVNMLSLKSTFTNEIASLSMNGSDVTNEYLNDQLQIFEDFLRYQKTAEAVNKGIQGLQYDTKSFGKNLTEAKDLLFTTEQVMSDGNIINYNEAFEDKNSFIGAYKKTIETVLKDLKESLLTTQNEVINKAFENFFKKYFNPKVRIGRDKRVAIVDAYRKDLLTYLLTSKKLKLKEEGYSEPLNSEINSLFIGEKSIPNKLAYIQEQIRKNTQSKFNLLLRNNRLIAQLFPVIDSEKSISNISFHSRKLDALETDAIVEGWRELLNSNDSEIKNFGYDLIKFILLQSGAQNSPINFVDFIPNEIYSKVINSILLDLDAITETEMNSYEMQFIINNYNNDDIVPKISSRQLNNPSKISRDPVLFPVVKHYAKRDAFEFTTQAEISKLLKQGKRVYKSKPDLYLWNGSELIPIKGVKAIRNFREKESLMEYGTSTMKAFSTTKKESLEKYSDFSRGELLEDYSQNTGQALGEQTIELKDGFYYEYADITTEMLENLGYSIEEIGKIIKEICK